MCGLAHDICSPPPLPPLTPTFTPTLTNTPTPIVILGDVDCNQTADSIDAVLVLQFGAGLLPSLPCPAGGDANQDGTVNVLDAALILQFVGGLVDTLPPVLSG